MMRMVQDRASQFRSDAGYLATDLTKLRDGFNKDASNFSEYTRKMNSLVEGDEGLLSSLERQIVGIDSKISGLIASTVLSGLGIVGGAVMIFVGAVTEIVSGGASTALVLGGGAVLLSGIGGTVGSAVTLSNLINQKGKLLRDQASLKAEVRFVQGLSGQFAGLQSGAEGAALSAQQMANAWGGLGAHLGNLIGDLEAGRTEVNAVRQMFQLAARADVKNVLEDNKVIKRQLAGVSVREVPAGETLGDNIVAFAKAA